jgi:hydrogenase/urease accessory protein HupE
MSDLSGLLIATALLHICGLLTSKFLDKKFDLITRLAGLSTLCYGSFLIAQLTY